MQIRAYKVYIIVLFTVCKIFAQEKGFIPYKLDKKWVVLNDSCQIISKEKYDTVCLMSGGLARAKIKKNWGYINKKGETVIPFIYNEISGFDNASYALVRIDKKWGFVNKKSLVVIPIIYDALELFNPYDEYAKGKIGDSTFFVDRKGNRKTGLMHPVVCGTGGGAGIYFEAQEIKGEKGWGLLENSFDNRKNKFNRSDTLVPCIFKKISYLMESPIAILINDRYSAYTTTDKKTLIADCDTMYFQGGYNNPVWVLFTKNKLKGCITPDGKNLLEPNYKSLKIINPDFIYVTDNENKSYYVNSKGKRYILKRNA